MTKLIDITGITFGRLTAIDRVAGLSGGHVMWRCSCTCGNSILASSQNLRKKHTQSCGCLQKDIMRKIRTAHGMTGGGVWTPEYRLWASAKFRADKKGIEFSISPTDIKIPPICPLLGIPLVQNTKTLSDNSATLDRILPEVGYTKENIWVVSYKANRSKNNLSLDEMRRLLGNLEFKINLAKTKQY